MGSALILFGIALDLAPDSRERAAHWPGIVRDSGLSLVQRFEFGSAQIIEFAPGNPTTDQRDRSESHILTPDGEIVLFDGVLDYRGELVDVLDSVERDSSDIELFAAAWDRWGSDCMQHLHGDFAAVVWNPRTGMLWATTDHCAEVKVYYARAGTGLVLSTHLPLVARTPGVDRTLNWRSLSHMIIGARETTLGETPFRAVSYIPGGDTARWQLPGQISETPQLETWVSDLHLIATHRPLRPGEFEQFIDVFRDAVRTRCSTTAGTTATLSGGLDSTLVAGFAARALAEQSKTLDCQTAVPSCSDGLAERPGWSHDDWHYAQTMAQLHDNLQFEAVPPSGICFLDQIESLVRCGGAPVRNVANYDWIGGIARRAYARGSTVVLTGVRGNLTVSRACPRSPGQTFLRAGAVGQGVLAGRSLVERVIRRVRARGRSHGATIELDAPGAWAGGWSEAYGLVCSTAIADIEHSASIYKSKVSAFSLAMARVHMAYVADPWACFGVRFRDPTCDRRVLAALAPLPAIAYFWRGQSRGVARRAGVGCVPDTIRARTIRGTQAPEESQAPQARSARYLDVWRYLQTVDGFDAHFDARGLDARYRRFARGEASRLEAMFMHRLVSFAVFHRVQHEWGTTVGFATGLDLRRIPSMSVSTG